MHTDDILLMHRQHTREAVAHAEHLRHLRTAHRDSRPRAALSRLLARATSRRADRTSPSESRDAPESGPLPRGAREVAPEERGF